MQRFVATPKEYFASLDDGQKAAVMLLRSLIKKAAPKAKESIKWGMLYYDLGGGLFGLAAQKHYVSLYIPVETVNAHKALLKGVSCGKCCLRFRKKEDIPVEVIKKLLTAAVKLGAPVAT